MDEKKGNVDAQDWMEFYLYYRRRGLELFFQLVQGRKSVMGLG